MTTDDGWTKRISSRGVGPEEGPWDWWLRNDAGKVIKKGTEASFQQAQEAQEYWEKWLNGKI